MSGRAPRFPRVHFMKSDHVALTPYPHYGLAFGPNLGGFGGSPEGGVLVRVPRRRVGPKLLLIGSYVRDPRCTGIEPGAGSARFVYLLENRSGGTGLGRLIRSILLYIWIFSRLIDSVLAQTRARSPVSVHVQR